MKPISPDEVVEAKAKYLPDFVIEGFNECIAKNFNGRQSIFTQDEAIETLTIKGNTTNMTKEEFRQYLFDSNYLDVEEVYRDAGWKVEYDRPGYNETYQPKFIFTK